MDRSLNIYREAGWGEAIGEEEGKGLILQICKCGFARVDWCHYIAICRGYCQYFCNWKRVLSICRGYCQYFCNWKRVLSICRGYCQYFCNQGEGTDTLCEDNHPQNLDGIGVFSLVCSDKEILLTCYNILIVEVEDSGIGVDCRLYIQTLLIDDGNVWLLRD